MLMACKLFFAPFLIFTEGDMKRFHEMLLFAEELGRVILAHLLCCAGIAVCLYSRTPRALHLRQTNAMHN